VIVNEFHTAAGDLQAPRARDRRPAGKAPDEPERGLLNTPAVQAPGYKREKSGRHGKRLGAELLETVTMLAKDESLPRRYFDHRRGGEWSDYRDCHIKRDLLLIYRKPDEASRELVRLGSHGELGL
jgi:mRNA interferase YafQ